MIPEPYTSPWCATTHYHIQGLVRGEVVHAVVPNGVQATDGQIFPNRREARTWLRANGFTPKKVDSGLQSS